MSVTELSEKVSITMENLSILKIAKQKLYDSPLWKQYAGRWKCQPRDIMGERILWNKVNFSITNSDKIGITGANGSGKTTFLLKILKQENGITVSLAVTFGYFSQMLEVLNTKASMMENVMASSVQNETIMRTVLARLGFIGEDVFKPVHVLSGGERVKAALAKLFVSSANVLVLDEPTNFLDISAVKAFEALLIDYSGTVLFITHDRRLLANAATKLFALKEQQLMSFEGPL